VSREPRDDEQLRLWATDVRRQDVRELCAQLQVEVQRVRLSVHFVEGAKDLLTAIELVSASHDRLRAAIAAWLEEDGLGKTN